MATQYEANFTYTDQQLLDLFRECLARIAVSGQSYQMPGGRMFTAANLTEVRNMVSYYEAKVGQASGTGSTNYARLKRPS